MQLFSILSSVKRWHSLAPLVDHVNPGRRFDQAGGGSRNEGANMFYMTVNTEWSGGCGGTHCFSSRVDERHTLHNITHGHNRRITIAVLFMG